MTLARVREVYVAIAVFALNVILSFIALNILAAWIHPEPGHDWLWPGLRRHLPRVYPDLTPAELDLLATESIRDQIYEPYTDFGHPPVRGRFVNIDEHGFRWGREQAPWPIDRAAYNVFAFGGSTTFGYGVADRDTIPSYLQDDLGTVGGRPARVYNFARSGYYSTQERILFERLVSAGHVPDAAVFVDGLNEFAHPDDRPWGANLLAARIGHRAEDRPSTWATAFDLLPLAVTMRHLGRLVRGSETVAPVATVRDDPAEADRIIARWVRSRTLVEGAARAVGIATTFVWQPIQTYGRSSGGSEESAPVSDRAGSAYARMAAYVAEHQLGPSFVWCAEPPDESPDLLYVDAVHYTPRMAERIARCASDAMRARGLVPRS